MQNSSDRVTELVCVTGIKSLKACGQNIVVSFLSLSIVELQFHTKSREGQQQLSDVLQQIWQKPKSINIA